jgi:Rod binding domain-containing protein
MSTISGAPASWLSSYYGLSSSGFATAAMPPSSATPALGKSVKAAREFEAQLIGTVLQSLETTFAAIPGQDAMAGEDDYNYLGTQALASAVATGGGFGIAQMITEYLGHTKVAHEGLNPAAPEPVSAPVKFL